MKTVDQYLDAVCTEIKCQEVHEEIRMELQSHIEDMVESYLESGYSEEEAIERAVSQMGDATLVGQQFNEVHKPRTEWGVIAAVAAFIGIGFYAMNSLIDTNTLSFGRSGDLVGNKMIAVLLGTVLLIGLYFFDYRKLKRYSAIPLLVTLPLMAVLPFIGSPVNGVPHVRFMEWTFNLIALSPILLLLALAGLFAKWNWQKLSTGWLAALLLILPCILFMAVRAHWFYLFEYVVGYLFLVAGLRIRRRQFLTFGLLPAASFSLFSLWVNFRPGNAHMYDRLRAFLNPYQYAENQGYSTVQSWDALKAAGWWGQVESYSFDRLPSVESDYVFTYVVYTLGWSAGVVIFLLGTFLTLRLLRIARQVKDQYGSLLVTVIVVVFAVQFYWNLLMVVGLAPLASAVLPFIPHGGSYLLVQMGLMGLALSVYRRKDMTSSAQTKQPVM